MYECVDCGYKTNRSYNFKLHTSRKTNCKPKVILHIDSKDAGYMSIHDKNCIGSVSNDTNYIGSVSKDSGGSALKDESNKCYKCSKTYSRKSGLTQHLKKCNGVKTIHCSICLKVFASAQTKCEHKKNVKCKPPVELETLQEEIERLKEEKLQMAEEIHNLKSVRPIIINNSVNNITNIQYNNYDKPYTDHITNTIMKGIYESSQRDPALILNETVRRIYKNDKYPENHVIKIGEKTALSKVFKDGKEIWIPMDGVIQTVLSNTGDFCADRLRDCHEEGVIEGTNVVVVWKLMEVLATDDREVDCLNRATYIQSIKSAFL
jgi:hypothetical protein